MHNEQNSIISGTFNRLLNNKSYEYMTSTVWKVSVFGVILVPIFLHLDWIWRDASYHSVFNPDAGNYGPE